MAKNLPHLWCNSQKTRPKTKQFFFIADSRTCQVVWGLEQLSSAIGWVMLLLRRTWNML